MSGVVSLNEALLASRRTDCSLAKGDGIWGEIEGAVGGDDSARFEGVGDAPLEEPSRDVDIEVVGIGEFQVFVVLVSRSWIVVKASEVDGGLTGLWRGGNIESS